MFRRFCSVLPAALIAILALGACDLGTGPDAAASVTLSRDTATVVAGAELQLQAIPLDASGSPLARAPVAWSSSDPGVATVSGAGVVTGVAPGRATVTASSGAGTGTATITVKAAPPAYDVTFLGAHLGYFADGTDINDLGHVAGWWGNGGPYSYHSVVWAGGSVRELIPPGLSASPPDQAIAINNGGDVAGVTLMDRSRDCTATFLWRNGTFMEPFTSAGCPRDRPTDINDAGYVVGTSQSVPGGGFLWRDGVVTPLDGEPQAINNRGDVLLVRGSGVSQQSWIWKDGVYTPVPGLGGRWVRGLSINDSLHVVGAAETAAGAGEMFIWKNGTPRALGVPSDGSRPLQINNRGEIAGVGGNSATGFIPVIGVNGDVFRADGIFSGTRWRIVSLGGINASGQIAASVEDLEGRRYGVAVLTRRSARP